MNWFYEQSGGQQGPVGEREFERLIAQGVIVPATLVWREGLPAWTALSLARPSAAPAMAMPAAPGLEQCQACERFFDSSDLVLIAGRHVCAGCKPAVLQGLEQGVDFSSLSEPQRTGPAWEQRLRLGVFRAAFETVKAVLFRPTETFKTMRTTGGLSAPMWYQLLLGGLGTSALLLTIGLVGAIFIARAPGIQMPLQAIGWLLLILTMILASFAAHALAIFIQAGLWHLSLMACGGARRPFETTFRTLSYAFGSAGVLFFIPVLGLFLVGPWAVVVTCIGLARAHETDLWRTVLALFLPTILAFGLGFVGFMISLGLNGLPH